MSNYYIMEADVVWEMLSYFRSVSDGRGLEMQVIHDYNDEDEEFSGLLLTAVDSAHTRMAAVYLEKSSFIEYEYTHSGVRDYALDYCSLRNVAESYSSNPLESGEIKLTEDLSMDRDMGELLIELKSNSITNKDISVGICRRVNLFYNINDNFSEGRDKIVKMVGDDSVSMVVNADSFKSIIDYVGRLLENEVDSDKVTDKSAIEYVIMGYLPSEYPDDTLVFGVEREDGIDDGFCGDVITHIQLDEVDSPGERDIWMKCNLNYLFDLVDTFDEPFNRNRKLKFRMNRDYPLLVEQDEPNNFDGYFISAIAPVVEEGDDLKNIKDLDIGDIHER